MKITLYQVDAFTDRVFRGNPAAVCPLQQWLADDVMQQIALENNLAETAFLVPEGEGFHIRWFTPAVEVDLCGHATLASAYVLYEMLDWKKPEIQFQSRSGLLTVRKIQDDFALDFPSDEFSAVPVPGNAGQILGCVPREAYKGKTDLLLVFENEEQIRNMQPDFSAIATLGGRGLIVTAPGNAVDFVSRFFAPQSGIPEDPVTGSAHTTLTPYWAARLQKNELSAMQVSARGGFLKCTYNGKRVEIKGRAVLYMRGEIIIS